MNAQAILIKIEEDAQETAARLSNDAKAKAEELKTASREKIEGMHKAILAQAQKDSAELEQRMLRMAELDARKALLTQKRALIDKAFTLAAQMLEAMPAAEKRTFFIAQVVQNARGHETVVIGETDANWFDDRFLAYANAALALAGKPAALTLAAERQPGFTGLTLNANGAQLRCTLDALLDEARTQMEQQVADQLFSE